MANHGGAYVSPGAGSSMNKKVGSSPVYQIDFTAVASGKRIASTKRRIRWRFGFTNQDALAAGETGTACRGEEHDITVVWSITSGKRLVLADGQEVHYSNSRSNVLEFSWTMRGNHVMKIICHASPPINVQPGFRQYDFYVDGQSFFSMPKVYRLGLNVNVTSASAPGAAVSRGVEAGALALATSSRRTAEYSNYSVGSQPTTVTTRSAADIAALETPHNVDEEQAYLAEAIKNSLVPAAEEASKLATPFSAPAPKGAGEDLLLDFFSEPAPIATSAQQPAQALAAASPPVQTNQQSFTSAPQPSFNDIANQFAPPAPVAQAPVAGYGYNQNAATVTSNPFAAAPAPESMYNASAVAPALAPESMYNAAAVAPSPVLIPASQPAFAASVDPQVTTAAPAGLGNDAHAAYENLSKMDSFSLAPKPDRSNPFDAPLQPPAPTLAGMKGMNANQPNKRAVMNNASPPGALVVTGSQQGNWSGYGQQMGSMNQGMYGQQPPPQYGQQPTPQYGMQPTPQYGMQQNGAPAAPGYNIQNAQQTYQQQQQGQYGQLQQPPPPAGQYYGQQY
uniref:Uncharacterized protein n=1 Tax=Eucampia antarctica TaxID=49252 RepID=A0A7S2RZE9_9STRA|mmetsp:Transcript_28845/g.27769  ORF Transcript_28845/g.27769 Transcript_28845/m.27769 type:complete len:564 (+) Transcript_28845:132-1823(+)